MPQTDRAVARSQLRRPPKRKRRPGEARKEQAKLLEKWAEVERSGKAKPCIVLNAPAGTYEIDRFFTELRANSFPLADWVPDDVSWIRKVVIAIGRETLEKTRWELACDDAFERDKQKRDLLQQFQRSIREIQVAFEPTFGGHATHARDAYQWLKRNLEVKDVNERLLAPVEPPCTARELPNHVASLEALCSRLDVTDKAQDIIVALIPATNLQKALEVAYAAAETWLKEYPPTRITTDNSPNKTPLVKWFMSHSANVWKGLITDHFLKEEEHDIFARMLAAAWKDLELDQYDRRGKDRTTKEYRWFRDRLKRSKKLIHFSF